MTNGKSQARDSEPLRAFCEAVLVLETPEECLRFLKDVATPSELTALSERWHVARLLDEGSLSYREIHDATGVSTTTITRVARFLAHEPNQGYRLILERLAGRGGSEERDGQTTERQKRVPQQGSVNPGRRRTKGKQQS